MGMFIRPLPCESASRRPEESCGGGAKGPSRAHPGGPGRTRRGGGQRTAERSVRRAGERPQREAGARHTPWPESPRTRGSARRHRRPEPRRTEAPFSCVSFPGWKPLSMAAVEDSLPGLLSSRALCPPSVLSSSQRRGGSRSEAALQGSPATSPRGDGQAPEESAAAAVLPGSSPFLWMDAKVETGLCVCVWGGGARCPLFPPPSPPPPPRLLFFYFFWVGGRQQSCCR